MSSGSEHTSIVSSTSEDIDFDSQKPSLLYHILSNLYQRKTSRILWLGKAVSRLGNDSRYIRTSSEAVSRSGTPPPAYSTLAEPSESTSEELPALCTLSSIRENQFTSIMASNGSDRSDRHDSTSGDIVPHRIRESESGVGWKYTNEGTTFMSRSVNEASSATQVTELTRSLYIDGVAYFLRGLPTDLSVEEQMRLSAALPPQLDAPHRPATAMTIESSSSDSQSSEPMTVVEQSFTRKVVAKITVCVALVVKFCLDYLALLLQTFYQYDRKHHLSIRAILNGAFVLDWVWKEITRLAKKICDLNDGQVGKALEELLRYLANEVSSGLYDGIGEAVGAEKAD